MTSFPLFDYKKETFALVRDLHSLHEFSQKLGLDLLMAQVNHIRQGIGRDSFSIAVVGEFNRGKSTFINALLGQEILPSDILATTAIPTRINYRSTSGAKICFKDGDEQEISIDRLGDYITKLTVESETRAEKIAEVNVYYNSPFLKKSNVEIIDTPGLNDDFTMTNSSTSILQQCDAAIMVISARSPFGISEEEFLADLLIRYSIDRVFFVVNQIDLFQGDGDAVKIIRLIKDRIQIAIEKISSRKLNNQENVVKNITRHVFGISALQALRARESNDMKLLAESRLVNFEYDLKTVIDRERELIRLRVVNNRMISSTTEILNQVYFQQSRLTLERAELAIAKDKLLLNIGKVQSDKTGIISLIDRVLFIFNKPNHVLVTNLEEKLKESAKRTIKSFEFDEAKYYKDNKSVQKDLAQKIHLDLQNIIDRFTREVQMETENSLSEALSSTNTFVDSLDRLIPQLGFALTINQKMTDAVYFLKQFCIALDRVKLNPIKHSFPQNLEIFVFPDEPSGVGTLIGTAVGAFVLTSLIGPFGIPVGAAIGSAIGDSNRASQFKEKYEVQVMTKIEEQVKAMDLALAMDSYHSQPVSQLEELRSLFMNVVNSCLDTTQNRLAEIFGEQEVKMDLKQQEVSQILWEVQSILDRTQQLSTKLNKLAA